MDINTGIISWLIFWITYWIFGALISWRGHVTGVRKVSQLNEVISNLLVNMMWTLLGTLMLCLHPLRALTDSHIIVKLIINYLITDIYFYHVHIMLHQSQLYGKLHALHHEFKEPYALAGLYATPYENIILNTFAAGLGVTILQIPSPYLYIWFFLISLNTLCTHSGYNFYFLIDGTHDYHHAKFHYNYGVSPYLDLLYGTYRDPFEKKEKKEIPKEYHLGNFPIHME